MNLQIHSTHTHTHTHTHTLCNIVARALLKNVVSVTSNIKGSSDVCSDTEIVTNSQKLYTLLCMKCVIERFSGKEIYHTVRLISNSYQSSVYNEAKML